MTQLIEIKTYFKKQVQAEFENPRLSPFTQDWQPGVDLLFAFIEYSINGINLYNDLLKTLEIVLINKPTDYHGLAKLVNYLAKYLLLISDLTSQTATREKPLTLMPLITAVLSTELPKFDCEHRADIDEYREQFQFVAHIYRAYCTHHEITHPATKDCLPDWADDQITILQNRNSILVVFLLATLLHYQALKKIFAEKQQNGLPNILPYLNQVADHFKQWQRRFVTIHGSEKIALYAQETLTPINRKPRQGTIEWLHQQIPMFMILGEAGMGKTTALQYLALETANKCQQTPNQTNLPVYLALKLFTGTRTLWAELLHQLPFDADVTRRWFAAGKISLFLDGLNEINQPLQQQAIQQIQSLINDYPKIRLLIASRSSHPLTLTAHQPLPIFALKKMTKTQIKTFLQRNTKPSTRQIIQTKMATNQRLLNWLRIPMLLKMMIEVVEDRQQLPKYQHEPIPNHKNELIESFIHKIYRWEQDHDINFSEITYDVLMTHLAGQIFARASTNIALKKDEVITILTEKVNSGFPNADLTYFLTVSTELGILTLNDNAYSFVHEAYFDYYVAKFNGE